VGVRVTHRQGSGVGGSGVGVSVTGSGVGLEVLGRWAVSGEELPWEGV